MWQFSCFSSVSISICTVFIIYCVGGQERNAQALNIWRRVKMKLEGRDPDLNKKASVAEQVCVLAIRIRTFYCKFSSQNLLLHKRTFRII